VIVNRRYIIPLAVFVISWLAGFVVSAYHLAYHKAAIRRMIDKVAENGEPVIVATGTGPYGSTLSRWYLCSFDSAPVPLDMNLGPDTGHAMLTEDGTLFIVKYSKGERENPDLLRIVLPGYRAEPVHEMIFGKSYMGSPWVVPAWLMHGVDPGDYASGVNPPWKDPGRQSGNPISYNFSADGMIAVFVTNAIDSEDTHQLWRHDIEDDSWTRISDDVQSLSARWPIFVGPDAALIGLRVDVPTSWGLTTGMVFIDGGAGDVVRSEPGMLDVVIGRRWVASSYTPIVPFNNLPVRSIVFFDLENNWEPCVIPWDELMVQALYEPPAE